jgi:hypothetical protein
LFDQSYVFRNNDRLGDVEADVEADVERMQWVFGEYLKGLCDKGSVTRGEPVVKSAVSAYLLDTRRPA